MASVFIFLGPIDEDVFKTLKEEGNQHVKDKNYRDALSKYSECLQINNKECAIYTNRQVLCNFRYFLRSYFLFKNVDRLIVQVFSPVVLVIYVANCLRGGGGARAGIGVVERLQTCGGWPGLRTGWRPSLDGCSDPSWRCPCCSHRPECCPPW